MAIEFNEYHSTIFCSSDLFGKDGGNGGDSVRSGATGG